MIVECSEISKVYDGVPVLQDINLTFNSGEIHALVGNNGAGKTTLIKILSGMITPTTGRILIDGKDVNLTSSEEACRLGIVACHQELNVFEELSITENLFLGNELRTKIGLFDWSNMEKETAKILSDFEITYAPETKMKNLPPPRQYMIQFIRALMLHPKVLILDELTDLYTPQDNEMIYRRLRLLAQVGVNIIFITHRIHEITRMADRVTVLRDGRILDQTDANHAGVGRIVEAMLGAEKYRHLPKIKLSRSERVLTVTNLCTGYLRDISFTLHRGEALGIAGLLGSGRTSLLRAIVGADPVNTGSVCYIDNSGKEITDPKTINKMVAYIPENKERDALFSDLSVAANITIRNMKRICFHHIILPATERIKSSNYADMVGLPRDCIDRKIRHLSNGEKRKSLVVRNAFCNSNVFIFDEVSNGIDTVGRVEVYNIMNEILRRGGGIIIVSSDFEELIGMCDRILVIKKGKITSELHCDDLSRETLLNELE